MKRKRPSTAKFKSNHPRKIGKFYHIFDTMGGHPVLVYYANPDEDTYYIQRFTQADRKGRILLKHNIDPNSKEKQWLVTKPVAVGYDDMTYLSKYDNYRIQDDDIATVKKYQLFDLKKKSR